MNLGQAKYMVDELNEKKTIYEEALSVVAGTEVKIVEVKVETPVEVAKAEETEVFEGVDEEPGEIIESGPEPESVDAEVEPKDEDE